MIFDKIVYFQFLDSLYAKLIRKQNCTLISQREKTRKPTYLVNIMKSPEVAWLTIQIVIYGNRQWVDK